MTDNIPGNLSTANPSNFPLTQLYFYLTEGCNLACRHCWLSPKLQTHDRIYPVLPVELFRSILHHAVPLGLKVVKLTGGEPLMHPHILEILDVIKEFNLGLTIETNGILCTPELAKKIASFNKPSISVSIDGADAETHESIRGIPGCFDKAINGIRTLVDAGLKPQVIFTLMQSNKNQIEPVVRLAESLKAGSVKFNIVQPTGRGEMVIDSGQALKVEELIETGKWISDNLSKPVKIKLFFDLPAAFRPLSRMYGEDGDGCASCSILKILGVLADGSYALCGIGNHIPELVFGNAREDDLSEIWNNSPVLLELREGIPSRFEGICGKCHMKRVCRASCIAQNYYLSNSLWSAFWFCDEAYKKGLFPSTRIAPRIN